MDCSEGNTVTHWFVRMRASNPGRLVECCDIWFERLRLAVAATWIRRHREAHAQSVSCAAGTAITHIGCESGDRLLINE